MLFKFLLLYSMLSFPVRMLLCLFSLIAWLQWLYNTDLIRLVFELTGSFLNLNAKGRLVIKPYLYQLFLDYSETKNEKVLI